MGLLADKLSKSSRFANIVRSHKIREKMSRRKTIGAVASETQHLAVEFKPKTKGQYEYVKTMIQNSITFVTGEAGTGKSFLALGLCSQYILDGSFDNIIVARPAVEASSRGLGYLSGSLEEKLSPFVFPAVMHLRGFLGDNRYYSLLRDGKIKFESLEYMRGRTYGTKDSKSFVLLEEAQNCTTSQLVMIVTRIGEGSKLVINGDSDQTDLRNSGDSSDLMHVISKVQRANIEGFGVSKLTEDDIVRNPLIKDFLRAMR